MKARSNDTELGRYALAIGVWENEGGAPALDTLDNQYDKKIERTQPEIKWSPAYRPMSVGA